MAERSPDRPPAVPPDDGTRDIRLPPLPDRPPPAVPPEWASYVASPGSAPGPDAARVDEPTDRLASSSAAGQNRTLAFNPPPRVELLKVTVTPRRGRTGRMLWVLIWLTVAVIVAAGVALAVFVTQR